MNEEYIAQLVIVAKEYKKYLHNKNIIDQDMDTEEITQLVLVAREYAQYLYNNNLIDQDMKIQIEARILDLQKEKYVFITKPFHTCDSVGETLFHLMRALQKNVSKLNQK